MDTRTPDKKPEKSQRQRSHSESVVKPSAPSFGEASPAISPNSSSIAPATSMALSTGIQFTRVRRNSSSPRSEGGSPRTDSFFMSSAKNSPRSPRKSSPRFWSITGSRKKESPRDDSPRIAYGTDDFSISEFELSELMKEFKEKKTADEINQLSGFLKEYEAANGKCYDLILTESVPCGKNYFLAEKPDQSIGAGATSTIHKSYHLETTELVILKLYDVKIQIADQMREEQALIKMGLMRGRCSLHDTIAIFMPYFKGCDLNDRLYETTIQYDDFLGKSYKSYNKKKYLSFSDKVHIASLLIKSLLSIHEKGLIHRDLKSENIRFNKTFSGDIELAIIDFGSAASILEFDKKSALFNNRVYSSTFGYGPPEACMYKGESRDDKLFYSLQSDYFMLGVILAEIFTEENYQAGVHRALIQRRKRNEQIEMTPEEIAGLMPDIFAKSKEVSEPEALADIKSIDAYAYHKIFNDKYHDIICRLTQPEPRDRITHGELKRELRELELLERKFDQVLAAITRMSNDKALLASKGIDPDKLFRLFPVKTLDDNKKSLKPSLSKTSPQIFQ